MERITIRRSSRRKARALRYAQEHRISLGELIRRSLTDALGHGTGHRRRMDPLFADRASVR